MKDGILVRRPVNGGTAIYTGSLVALGSDGYALPCPANVGSGNVFDGVAIEGTIASLTNVSDGDQSVLVMRKGLFYYKVTGCDGIDHNGVAVYVTDDNNLTVTAPALGVQVGRVVKYDGESGYAWVEFIFPTITNAA